MLLEKLSIEFSLFLFEDIETLLQIIIVHAHLLRVTLQLGNLLLAQAQQVLVTLQLELSLAVLLLFSFCLLLEEFLLILELVLHAFDMQLKLLFDFYMVAHLGLVFLQHLLILARGFIATDLTLALIS